MQWIVLALILIAFSLFLYWLLVTTEGVFLGRRVVVWLYDLTAYKYDRIKQYDSAEERLLVVNPVLHAVAGTNDPLVLDVATGTGRVPEDLLQAPEFAGRFVALDDSRRMLNIAGEKLARYGDRVRLVRHPAVPLPFPNDHFDAVTCLEALEFFPSDEAALQEMVRVLRPGGVLITTRRRGHEGRAFLHRYRSEANMQELLFKVGLERIHFYLWEVNYDLVMACKPSS